MKVRVVAPNLYRNGHRCAIGQTFDVDGDTIPLLYRGKVEKVPEPVMTVATPDAKANDTGVTDTSGEADNQRRAWLMDQLEDLTGKRPGANTKTETLEANFEKAKLTKKE